MRSAPIAVVRTDGLTHSYADRRVLDSLSLTVPPGERLGVIGENGAGKSTLLRLLAGVEHPDEGEVARPLRTGWLSQEVRVDDRATLLDLVEHEIAPLRRLERELAAAAEALARVSPDAPAGHPAERPADRYDRLLAEAERVELWSLDARRDELLDGLGVGRLPLETPVGEVSGGQRSRVALAALLLSAPDALLLDEPTNHLDDTAVAFLASRLRAFRGPAVFASHDRAFLDDVATALLDLDPSRRGATRFGGGATGRIFADFLVEKAAERTRWEQRHAAEEDEQKRLERAIAVTARTVAHDRGARDNDRFIYGFKGGRVQQQISRRVRDAQGRLADLVDERVEEPPPILAFAGIPTGAHALEGDEPLLTARGIRIDGRLELPELDVAPGARLLVTGPNGAGKSTLLAALAGSIRLDAGGVRRRKGLRIGMLAQDIRWDDPRQTPRRLYTAVLGEARAEARPLEATGLLADRDLDRPVGRLSIGQQRRVALALTIAKPPHLFLLDEPTNHLSLALASELERALDGYPGAVIVASHDRWLRRRWRGEELRLTAA